MTWYVERGEPLHPVVQMALEETEETSAETVVQPGSPADGHSLKDLRVETETGMFVLAVQRGQRWIYRPRGTFTLRGGGPADLGRPRGGRGGALGALAALRFPPRREPSPLVARFAGGCAGP